MPKERFTDGASFCRIPMSMLHAVRTGIVAMAAGKRKPSFDPTLHRQRHLETHIHFNYILYNIICTVLFLCVSFNHIILYYILLSYIVLYYTDF